MKRNVILIIIAVFLSQTAALAGNCLSPVAVYCGDYIYGDLSAGTDTLAGDTCSTWPDLGNEDIYTIYVEDVPATLYLQITNQNTDPSAYLDVSVTTSCDYTSCIAGDYVEPGYVWNVEAELGEAGSYYIIVSAEDVSAHGPYILDVSCDLALAPLDCANGSVGPLTLACGSTAVGSTADSRVYNASEYGCCSGCDNLGPELVYTVDTTGQGPRRLDLTLVTLTPAGADLDLFVLDACAETECVAQGKTGSNPELVTTEVLPPGVYYVVVDGYGWAAASFSLTLQT